MANAIATQLNANDLRIGNWVKIGDHILCVKAISETLHLGNSVSSDFIHDDFNYSDISPIELTPEILEKCGFVKSNSNYYQFPNRSHLYELTIHKSNLGFHFQMVTKRMVEPRTVIGEELKHLHKLQNLFYALTGTELEVNL